MRRSDALSRHFRESGGSPRCRCPPLVATLECSESTSHLRVRVDDTVILHAWLNSSNDKPLYGVIASTVALATMERLREKIIPKSDTFYPQEAASAACNRLRNYEIHYALRGTYELRLLKAVLSEVKYSESMATTSACLEISQLTVDIQPS